MEAVRLLKSFCSRGFSMVSDGDIDGILGSALITIKLRELGLAGNMVGVSFPPPGSLIGSHVSQAIMVELPLSRGYSVVDEILVFDHHEFVGAKILGAGGREIESIVINRNYASISSLIRDLLDIETPSGYGAILRAADLIDSGRSSEDPVALKIHRAYLFYIDDQEMRHRLYRSLVEGDLGYIYRWADEGSRGYERSREEIPKIISRAQIHGSVAITWINQSSREERVAMREAMLELEKQHEIAVVLEIDGDLVKRIHLGSIKSDVRPLLQKTLEELKRRGVRAAGGGRQQAGGIQIPEGVEAQEIYRIVSSHKS